MIRFFVPFRQLLIGWVISFAFWGSVAVLLGAHMMANGAPSWESAVQPGLRDWLPWALVSPLLFRLASRLPLDRQNWKRALPVHLVVCALVLISMHAWKSWIGLGGPGGGPPFMIWRGASNSAATVLDEVFPESSSTPGGPGPHAPGPMPPPGGFGPGGPGPGDGGSGPRGGFGPPPGGFHDGNGKPPMSLSGFFDLFHFFTFELPLYVALMSAAHAGLFYRQSQERAASLARARLESLRMQLHPHFLFNTLNTISGLVHEEPDKADAMLTSLSELLRLSLDTTDQQELPLERELIFVEKYLAIMQGRFEERLRFELVIDNETRRALVPTFLLQPLVENAVQHGIEPRKEGGRVRVKAVREGKQLVLTIADDGVGMPLDQMPRREGIGLGNTRARLQELYGSAASLEVRDGGGLTVEIRLPFQVAESL